MKYSTPEYRLTSVATQSEIGPLLRLLWSRAGTLEGAPCGFSAAHFSTDQSLGACADCSGQGLVARCDPALLVTAPDLIVARELARGLVENELAACANLVPGIRSIYRWEGKIEDEEEVLMVIKTTAARLDAVERWVIEKHPYDTPECLALEPAAVEARYLAWLEASCGERGGSSTG